MCSCCSINCGNARSVVLSKGLNDDLVEVVTRSWARGSPAGLLHLMAGQCVRPCGDTASQRSSWEARRTEEGAEDGAAGAIGSRDLMSVRTPRSASRWLTVAVQLPMTDTRLMAASTTGRLTAPSWPDPLDGIEFVRGVGIVQARGRGGIEDTIGERSFVDARPLLRIHHPPATPFRLIYRRLYSTGVGMRLEVAARYEVPDYSEAIVGMVTDSFLALRVRLPSGQLSLLENSGPRLAEAMTDRTTSSSWTPQQPTLGISAGLPAVFVEARTSDQTRLTGLRFQRLHRAIPAWLSWLHPDEDWTLVRQQRGRVWNLHMRLEALRAVFRGWQDHRHLFDREALCEYLAKETHDLSKLRAYGLSDQPRVIAFNRGFGELAPDDVLSDLRKELLQRGAEFERQLNVFLERTRPRAVPETQINIGSIFKVNDKSQHISNSTVGVAAAGNAHVQAGNIQGSGQQNVAGGGWEAFEKSVDLPKLAAELEQLKQELRVKADDPSQFEAVAEIAHAEAAAKEGDSSKLREHLGKAGKWALEIAKGVGIATAAAALKSALGL